MTSRMQAAVSSMGHCIQVHGPERERLHLQTGPAVMELGRRNHSFSPPGCLLISVDSVGLPLGISARIRLLKMHKTLCKLS